MKRIFSMLAACLLLGGGCSDSGSDTGKKVAGETFTVGFDEDFAPFTFKDPAGEYAGYDLDLAREVARRNSWKFAPVPMDWRMKETLLNSGKIDCIWSSFHMNDRENLFEWSRPYTIGEQVVVVHEDSPVIGMGDLSGRTVAVQAGCVNYDAWNKGAAEYAILKFKKFIPVEGFSVLMQNFTEKAEYDAVITDETAFSWWCRHHSGELRVVGDPVQKAPCGVAFRRGNRKLRDQVQKTLDEMAADGALARIGEKWFGRDITCPELAEEKK